MFWLKYQRNVAMFQGMFSCFAKFCVLGKQYKTCIESCLLIIIWIHKGVFYEYNLQSFLVKYDMHNRMVNCTCHIIFLAIIETSQIVNDWSCNQYKWILIKTLVQSRRVWYCWDNFWVCSISIAFWEIKYLIWISEKWEIWLFVLEVFFIDSSVWRINFLLTLKMRHLELWFLFLRLNLFLVHYGRRLKWKIEKIDNGEILLLRILIYLIIHALLFSEVYTCTCPVWRTAKFLLL